MKNFSIAFLYSLLYKLNDDLKKNSNGRARISRTELERLPRIAFSLMAIFATKICVILCAGETDPIEGIDYSLQITRFDAYSCGYKASGMHFVTWLCYFVAWRQSTSCCRSFEGKKKKYWDDTKAIFVEFYRSPTHNAAPCPISAASFISISKQWSSRSLKPPMIYRVQNIAKWY